MQEGLGGSFRESDGGVVHGNAPKPASKAAQLSVFYLRPRPLLSLSLREVHQATV